MDQARKLTLATLAVAILSSVAMIAGSANAQTDKANKDSIESKFLSNTRQLTFEGKRAGEGYFSGDGSLLVFQSERRADNPFFQIYLLDLETGDSESISPGHGKTTCSWIHPDNNLVLYSSTQNDPEAKAKQKAEIEFRESGKARRYSWDYDETYELYAFDRTTKKYNQLTDAKGYDAEASYSPDGKLIAFASNRNGYSKPLDDKQKKMFETDPAYMMDIFIMDADGKNVKQLTDVPGYDGGPFFSPDGKKICWRRFSENGLLAEIMTMNIDGTDQKQITKMNAMSWAPFYHPTGEYLIYTTNKHGFSNFELYIVAADGKSEPVRITDTDGFDGLASFTPDGDQLTWTSNRNAKKESQIYLANWNHAVAREKVIAGTKSTAEESEAFETGTESAKQANVDFDQRDIMRHVDYLCRKELGGRMTGSAGERKATAYMAAYLDHLGLVPAGDNGTWFQEFDFPAGTELGPENRFEVDFGKEELKTLKINKDWRPLTFSGNVDIDLSEVVYAGYGIVSPEKNGFDEYDSYVHLDVKDKWVMVFRFVPEKVTPEHRRHFQFYGELRKKAFFARDHGAKGLIVVSGPNSNVRKQLVPMQNDFSPSGSSIAAISITDSVASEMLKTAGKDLKKLQDKLEDGSPVMGFDLKGFHVSGKTSVKKITGKGRNVIGRLMVGDKPSDDAIIVGAHIDHLGAGGSNNSLARNEEQGNIHFGADDNASGVAATLEIAEYIASQRKKGKLKLKRDIIFAGWSGEELGLHGSQHYVDSIKKEVTVEQEDPKRDTSHDFVLGITKDGDILLNGKPSKLSELKGSLKFIATSYPTFEIEIATGPDSPADKVTELTEFVKEQGIKTIKRTELKEVTAKKQYETGIVAALNMDMVGRMKDKVILQGVSSSSYWAGVVESKNVVVGLPVALDSDVDLPTDASSFYRAGIPILSAFTGSHTDYHTPRDTPEKLNYPDAARIARLMGLITRSLATNESVPDYIKQDSKPKVASRGQRAYLGTVPSYGDDITGVKLSDVTVGAPAEVAGVQGGDIIVSLGGKEIENIYDYTAILDGIKIGDETTITVIRDGKRKEFKITPGSRQ